jgi:outer membrane protein assembly factor BamB
MKLAFPFAAMLTLAATASSVDDNWPQWRGPDGLGLSAATSYADEWSPTNNVAWKTPVPGRGFSSPIVWRDRVFLTTSIEGEKAPEDHKAPIHPDFNHKPGYFHPDSVGVDRLNALKVLAFDAKTGTQLWEQTAYDGLMYDNRHRKNTYASPTMVTDGKLVYAFFESAGLYAYDFSGRQVWKKSLGGIAKAGLGPGTSPVLFENLIFLQCDQEMGDGSYIIALDRADGREVWRQQRTTRRSWATPLIVKTATRTELIASGAEVVVAYDPKTGL